LFQKISVRTAIRPISVNVVALAEQLQHGLAWFSIAALLGIAMGCVPTSTPARAAQSRA